MGGEPKFEFRILCLEPMLLGSFGMCAPSEVLSEVGELEECWSRTWGTRFSIFGLTLPRYTSLGESFTS